MRRRRDCESAVVCDRRRLELARVVVDARSFLVGERGFELRIVRVLVPRILHLGIDAPIVEDFCPGNGRVTAGRVPRER